MLRLYRFDLQAGEWVFADYGIKGKEHLYNAMGFIVEYPENSASKKGDHHVEHAN